ESMANKVDYGSVVAVIANGEINVVPIGIAFDDDLVAGGVTHHRRAAPAFTRVECVAVARGVCPEIDAIFETLQFGIKHLYFLLPADTLAGVAGQVKPCKDGIPIQRL